MIQYNLLNSSNTIHNNISKYRFSNISKVTSRSIAQRLRTSIHISRFALQSSQWISLLLREAANSYSSLCFTFSTLLLCELCSPGSSRLVLVGNVWLKIQSIFVTGSLVLSIEFDKRGFDDGC